MKKKSVLTTATTLVLLGGLVQSTSAQSSLSYSQVTGVSSWTASGTAVYQTGGAPETGSGGSSNDNDNWGGNANGTAGFGALGQAFVTSAAGVLQSAQIVLTGGTATFNVELYDLGAAPGGFPSGSPIGSNPGGTPTITQLNALGGAGGANLLSGATLTYNAAASSVLETINFTGTPINLAAGELYMLSLDPTANADNTWWVRGGTAVSGYNFGEGFNADGVQGMQVFEGKSSTRNFDMEITESAVPEPGTIALGIIGASSFLFRRRK